MIRLSLRRLLSDKRRTVGTGLAIVLGVAFLCATLVLSDTMRTGFAGLFGEANAGIDLAVRNETGFGEQGSELFLRGTTDEAVAARVAAVPGVAAVAAEVEGVAQIVGSDGDAIGGGGPPTVGAAWIDDPELNPFVIREGRAPAGPGEVVIDAGSASTGGLTLGDRVELRVPEVVQSEVVGIVGFGDRDAMAGATFAGVDHDTAQAWFTGPGQLTSVLVRAEDGVDAAALRNAVAAAAGGGSEVLTGADLTAEDEAAIASDFLGLVESALLAFAGVALVVAGFSINNTFMILVSQRSRESSLLRALGASRAQVLRAVAVESIVVGLVASLVGSFVGLGLAEVLRRLMASSGMDFGAGGLVVSGLSLALAVGVGLVITVLSSVLPAVRGSRAAPLAALRATAVEATVVGRFRVVVGGLFLAAGMALVVASGSGGMAPLGGGALAALVGSVLLAPLAAVPVGLLLSRVTARLWPSGRIPGRLAGRNVVRNPRRTASSAVALVVGVTVVTLFATMAASMKTAMDDTVRRTFGGDIVVSAEWGSAGVSPGLAAAIGDLPEVEHAVPLRTGMVRIDGGDREVAVADPVALAPLADLGVAEGSLAATGPGQVAVSRAVADGLGLTVGSAVGSPVDIGFVDGATAALTVGAVYTETDLMGGVIVHPDDYLAHDDRALLDAVLVTVADGSDLGAAQAAVSGLARTQGDPDVMTRDEFIASVAGEVDQVLTLVYGLLGLAVLIALMGIANTLALSVHERTREIGLLRALGQSRSQLRATVRWESVVTAALGAAGGLALGTFLGWGVMRAAFADTGFDAVFTLPVTSIVAIVVLAVAAGVVASVRPARRAARLDVLDALATV